MSDSQHPHFLARHAWFWSLSTDSPRELRLHQPQGGGGAERPPVPQEQEVLDHRGGGAAEVSLEDDRCVYKGSH